ncbi:MAG: hypothetical protein Q9162_000218 [Coniocarpon cinnabarinum]
MSLFAPAPDPESPLARHRVLAPTAGIKVSPLCLGAMGFGDAWRELMGKCDKNDTFELLDYFTEQGGNFIDTANNYQNQESETWIGDWMEKRNNRDQLVLATKYTTWYKGNEKGVHPSQFTGNSAKSLRTSVNDSLKKLKTDYIDLLYMHWFDTTTSVEEVMQSLNRLVNDGKVLYLGISDTPAWWVAKANQYARDHGMTQFSVYQGLWNCAQRDLEREILPMCQAEGMAIAPWKALGGGQFKTEAMKEQVKAEGGGRNQFYGDQSAKERKITSVLEAIAKKRNQHLTGVAMAYVMNTTPDVFPIVGGRKKEHLKGNIDALKIRLTPEELQEIRDASEFETGFPLSMFAPGCKSPADLNVMDTFITRAAQVMDVASKRGPAFPPDAN